MFAAGFAGAVACLVACGNASAPPPASPPPALTATVTVEPASPPAAASNETPPPDDIPSAAPAAPPAQDPSAALADGKKKGRGTVLVFCAQWAVACREVEHAFADAAVKKRIDEDFVTARVDMTNDEAPDVVRNTKTFKVKGLPTIVVYDRKGKEVARQMSLLAAPELLAMLAKVK